MTSTIDLPDELHQRLEKQAQARGTTIAETVAQQGFWGGRLEAKGLVAKRKPAPPPTPSRFSPSKCRANRCLKSSLKKGVENADHS